MHEAVEPLSIKIGFTGSNVNLLFIQESAIYLNRIKKARHSDQVKCPYQAATGRKLPAKTAGFDAGLELSQVPFRLISRWAKAFSPLPAVCPARSS